MGKIIFENDDNNKNPNIHGEYATISPSYEAFDNAMAIISTRAFEGPSNKSVMTSTTDVQHRAIVSTATTTIIPMLDLCNHHRGNTQRNINYRFVADYRNDESSKDESKNTFSGVIVTAATDISAGETLKITYGARGNHILLLNYGFCIPNNFEQDGSCNDFYEFVPF